MSLTFSFLKLILPDVSIIKIILCYEMEDDMCLTKITMPSQVEVPTVQFIKILLLLGRVDQLPA